MRPASSSASAASSAARRAVPSASAAAASSPSSTSGSRANSSARRRSSPETGAGLNHRASFSHDWASLVRGTDGPGYRRGGNWSRAGQQGPPFVFTALRSCRAASAPSPSGTVGVRPLWHTGPDAPPLGRLPPLVRCAGSRRALALAARAWLAGCSSSEPGQVGLRRGLREARGAPPPRWPASTASRASCWTAARTRFEKRIWQAARPPGGGERLGVLVRALPLRVPVLPEAGVKRGKKIGVPRA